MLRGQMSPWQFEPVLNVHRNLPLKFHQNRVSNSWDIADIEFLWWWWGGVCTVNFEVRLGFWQLQSYKIAKLQHSNVAKLQNCKIVKLQNNKVTKLQCCNVQCCKVAKLQSCKFAMLQCWKVGKLQHCNVAKLKSHWKHSTLRRWIFANFTTYEGHSGLKKIAFSKIWGGC